MQHHNYDDIVISLYTDLNMHTYIYDKGTKCTLLYRVIIVMAIYSSKANSIGAPHGLYLVTPRKLLGHMKESIDSTQLHMMNMTMGFYYS